MFKIGDKIVHPMHGGGIIESIIEKTVCGETASYYLLRFPIGGMVVMIPVGSCESIGVRAVVSPEEAEEVMRSLAHIDGEMTMNWNRRYRENMEKLKSGSLSEVAEVIKGLILRDNEKGLSNGERKMLHNAKQIFISEIALAQDIDYEEVERRISREILK